MPLILARIDDRLIHGQVIVGWGTYLKPNRIILCSDTIATVPWQKEIYNTAGTLAPYDVAISIWTETETIQYFKEIQFDNEKVILLVETPHELLNLFNKGAPIDVINVGGMHFKQGKKQLAPFIFVDNNDLKYFKILKKNKIKLEGQDVPTSKKYDMGELIDVFLTQDIQSCQ